jgi:hypothetical protein
MIARELLKNKNLSVIKDRPHESFALIASIQGLPLPIDSNGDQPIQSALAKLARFLDD